MLVRCICNVEHVQEQALHRKELQTGFFRLIHRRIGAVWAKLILECPYPSILKDMNMVCIRQFEERMDDVNRLHPDFVFLPAELRIRQIQTEQDSCQDNIKEIWSHVGDAYIFIKNYEHFKVLSISISFISVRPLF